MQQRACSAADALLLSTLQQIRCRLKRWWQVQNQIHLRKPVGIVLHTSQNACGLQLLHESAASLRVALLLQLTAAVPRQNAAERLHE
jgi:hypothetical protein